MGLERDSPKKLLSSLFPRVQVPWLGLGAQGFGLICSQVERFKV